MWSVEHGWLSPPGGCDCRINVRRRVTSFKFSFGSLDQLSLCFRHHPSSIPSHPRSSCGTALLMRGRHCLVKGFAPMALKVDMLRCFLRSFDQSSTEFSCFLVGVSVFCWTETRRLLHKLWRRTILAERTAKTDRAFDTAVKVCPLARQEYLT